MTRLAAAAAALLALAGCGDDGASTPTDAGTVADTGTPADGSSGDAGTDAGPPPFEPDSYCPGPAGCTDEGDGVLMAGVAVADITPTITEVLTTDVDGDGIFDPTDGDEFDDANGNGRFDAVWIAGFGVRAATGIHDDLQVTALAVKRNDITIVLLALDCFGWFNDELVGVREMVSDLDVDFIASAASHSHAAPDSLGIYGPSTSETGVDPAYMDHIQAQAAAAIRDAVGRLAPAHIQYARLMLRDMPGGVSRYVGDNRDPYIVDDEVRIMRFLDASTSDTIVTVVNYAGHPEYFWDENLLVSADYIHYLRDAVTNGVDGPDGHVDGLGGVTMHLQGPLGGQIGPNHIAPERWDGTDVIGRSMEGAQTVGEQLGYFVIQALADGGGSVTDDTAALGFRNKTFFVDIQNRAFHVALLGDLFIRRQDYNWDPDRPLIPGENEPDLKTEVAVIDIGRAEILTAPGELFPEQFVGGYDGSYTPADQTMVDPGNPNPPNLDEADPGPYLRDLAREDAEYVFMLGLGMDQLGYLVPEWNYELDPTTPYFEEAPGDHYEETNGVGPDGWPTIRRNIEALLAWRP